MGSSCEPKDSAGDVFKQLAMLLGLVYFVFLLIFYACVAIVGKPARIWIPGKSLVISALTIQILSYLKIKTIKLSKEITSKDIQDHRQNLVVGNPGRVVTCVLIGYLLPGMARAGSATDWRTLVALALSLFSSEFYYLTTFFYYSEDENNFILTPGVTSVVTGVSIILVVLFSICAVLAGRTIRGMLAQRISVIQWDNGSWQRFEGEIVESWFLARVCQPQYVIARSVLSSDVGLIVTICILLLAFLQFYFLPWFRVYDPLFMTWTLEWAFILIGGTVIFCRWFTAVLYFPRFFVKKMKLRPFVEDYWTRRVLELVQMYNLQKWLLQERSKDGILIGLALRMATTMKVHYLLYLLWPLQISLVFFSKCCLFISELSFSFKFVWIRLLGCGKDSSQSKEFQEYREILEKVCKSGKPVDSQ